MPKRTNDFQRLIKIIYDQIIPKGGTVEESAMIYEKASGVKREVDILVSGNFVGHDVRFIVECRDRKRPADVTWIGELNDKRESLNINKIIAVSSSGFTSTAKTKAQHHGIETLTMEEAQETDWANFYMKPGIVVITNDIYHITKALFEENGQFLSIEMLGLNSVVEVNNIQMGTVQTFIQHFFEKCIIPQLNEKKKKNFLELFKTREDIEKLLLAQIDFDWEKTYVISSNGSNVELKKVRFVVVGKRNATDIKQMHRLFNQKMISTGQHVDVDGSILDFTLVQNPDTKVIFGRWDRLKRDDTKKEK